jgi:hypothetical protein
MILDTNELTDIQTSGNWLVGKANKETKILRKGERVMLFDGVRTALEYIDKNLPTAKRNQSSLGGSGHAGNTFKSYGYAMEVFLQRPQEVVKYDPTEIRPVEFEEQGNDLEFDVTGDFLDIGRVLEGVPENFGSLHNGNPRNRRVRIVVSLAQGWRMTPKEIDHRSERIIRLVDALENANIRTEVTAVDTNYCSHTEVVAVVTHTEFFRRMLFRASEWSDTWRDGYGDSTVLKHNVKMLESQLNDELSVYIDGNIHSYNIDDRFNKLEKMLEVELSELVPKTNLVWVDDDNIGHSDIKT